MQAATLPIEPASAFQQSNTSESSRCAQCLQHMGCLSSNLSHHEMRAFNVIPKQDKKLNRGEYLYQPGDRLDTIYIIKSGSIKNSIVDEEGREQVLNFSLRGDMIGLDGLFLNTYSTESTALETTYLCGVPVADYLTLASKTPKLYQKLLDHMSKRIVEEEQHSLLLGTKNADQRLAHFLLELSKRNREKGFSDHDLVLHMSRRDIGSYLSAAVETVSRLFTRLQDQGLIEVRGKYVHINNLQGLEAIST